jgi:hypothetical protein
MPRGKFYDLAPMPLGKGYFVHARPAEDGSNGVITEVRDRRGRTLHGTGPRARFRDSGRQPHRDDLPEYSTQEQITEANRRLWGSDWAQTSRGGGEDRRRDDDDRRRGDMREMRSDENPRREGEGDLVRAAGDPRPHVQAAALRDFKQRLRDHYRGRMRDEDLQELLDYFLEWAKTHTDMIMADPDNEGRDDPRLIRADRHDKYVLGPRRIAGLDREDLTGKTMGGATASERLSGYGRATQDARNPLAAINRRHKQFWHGRAV